MKPYEPTLLDKRVFCDTRDNILLHLGTVGSTSIGARTPPEFISFTHPAIEGTINASLIRVTPKLVFYRQVMSDGATNFAGQNQINDAQR